jgi:hypothetical protein
MSWYCCNRTASVVPHPNPSYCPQLFTAPPPPLYCPRGTPGPPQGGPCGHPAPALHVRLTQEPHWCGGGCRCGGLCGCTAAAPLWPPGGEGQDTVRCVLVQHFWVQCTCVVYWYDDGGCMCGGLVGVLQYRTSCTATGWPAVQDLAVARTLPLTHLTGASVLGTEDGTSVYHRHRCLRPNSIAPQDSIIVT